MATKGIAHANGRKAPAGDLPPEAYDRLPLAALVLTEESAWVMRYDRGQVIEQRPVALEQAAGALNRFGASTGLLPDGCLFWQHRRNQDRLAIWLPPARRTLQFSLKRTSAISVPLPGLVFVGAGQSYSIWAAHRRPATAAEPLYHCPLPNVFDHGGICAGSVKFPKCAPNTILAAAALFFESGFTDHLERGRIQGSGNAMAFLKSLVRKKEFPLNRLAPSGMSIGRLISQGETS